MKLSLCTSLIVSLACLVVVESQYSAETQDCIAKSSKCSDKFSLDIRGVTNPPALCGAGFKFVSCLKFLGCTLPREVMQSKIAGAQNRVRIRARTCVLPGGFVPPMPRPTAPKPTAPKPTAPKPTAPKPTVPVITDIADVEVVDCSAMYVKETQVEVSWRISTGAQPLLLAGFKILYRIASKGTKGAFSVQNVAAPSSEDGLYKSVLDLKRKSRYEIKVKPYSEKKDGEPCKPVYIYVSGINLDATPDLVLTAAPLASDAAVVSVDVIGDQELTNVNFLYMKKGGSEWTQLFQDIIAFQEPSDVAFTGLEEGTVYYIFGKAWLGNSYRALYTSLETPFSEGQNLTCGTSEDLTLKKQQNSNGSAWVDWSDWNIEGLIGYKATVTYNANGYTERTEIEYLPSDQTRLDFEMSNDTIDRVKIEPFDAYGLKEGAEVDSVRVSVQPTL
ncbi:hypothetical protein EGW08_016197 [Elysia chlorotica]|uniref:Fibronectin type-III domain-containing protein n=1 Tax=Elysia chlorotica TaxID=188477 RepID=A0A433T3A9_ELYCH|nr:hypothetical protein EGW08_016197 [Elysia chlorotica]